MWNRPCVVLSNRGPCGVGVWPCLSDSLQSGVCPAGGLQTSQDLWKPLVSDDKGQRGQEKVNCIFSTSWFPGTKSLDMGNKNKMMWILFNTNYYKLFIYF